MDKRNDHTTRYEELLCLVSPQVREEFLQIEAGVRLPELYYDIPFKRVFDADIHKDRLSRLFQLVFENDLIVESSMNAETSKASIYFKKTIRDILALMSNKGISNFEMQAAAQEFIVQRMDVYASDLIMLQYSVLKEERKSTMDFSGIRQSYCVVLMKESPRLFRDHPNFIHHKQTTTDTGIELPELSRIVYIELDKCLDQVRNGSYPKEKKELSILLAFLADVNGEIAKTTTGFGDDMAAMLLEIREELRLMSKDRKELIEMLSEKYAEDIRYSEKMQAERKGWEEGNLEGKIEGKAEGKIEGKAEGKVEGKVEGKTESKVEDILDLLEDHGNIPELLCHKIKSQKDLPTLKTWVKLASRAESIEAFEQGIQ